MAPTVIQHGPQTFNSRVADRLLEGFAFLVHLFDEIEQHNNMADDHATKTRDSQECHEADGVCISARQSHCAHHAIRSGREN